MIKKNLMGMKKNLQNYVEKTKKEIREKSQPFKTQIKLKNDELSNIRKELKNSSIYAKSVETKLAVCKALIVAVSNKLSKTSKYLNWKEALDTPEKFKANISEYLYRKKYNYMPNSADICQSNFSSCVILSTLIGLAKTNPGFIKYTLIDENNGKVIVRFHTDIKKPTVTNRVPLDYNIFSKCLSRCTHKAAWPLVAECAYIQLIESSLKSPLNPKGHGTIPYRVLFYLTGKMGEFELYSHTPKYEEIEKKLKEHKFALVSFDYVSSKDLDRDIGIYKEHEYCLLGVTKENGVEYVILQNPHGKTTMIMPTTYNHYEIDGKKVPEFKSLNDIELQSKIVKEFKMPLEKFLCLLPQITYFKS